MAYTKKTWENLPNTNTPLNTTGMNDLETRIANGFNIIDFLGIPTSEITAEDDLDDFVNEGTYIFEPETTDMPSNVPPMVYLSPFKLLVLNFPDYSDSESKMQIYIGYRGSAIYVRETQVGPSLQWLSWKKIVLNSDLGDKYYTSEQVVGTWIDGKPLYRTTVTVNSIDASNNYIDVSHGISNMSMPISVKGIAKITNVNQYRPLGCMFINTSGDLDPQYVFNVYAVTESVFTLCYGNWWKTRFDKAYITIEYTKTTD